VSLVCWKKGFIKCIKRLQKEKRNRFKKIKRREEKRGSDQNLLEGETCKNTEDKHIKSITTEENLETDQGWFRMGVSLYPKPLSLPRMRALGFFLLTIDQ
jgi:hypothetical protein